MGNLQVSNFCELFGFNFKRNPISRLSIKIESKIYPAGFEFIPGVKYQGYDISTHIDDLALVYFDENENLVLHMFVPDGTAEKEFVNRQPERKLYRYSKFESIRDAYENGHFYICPALEYIKKEYDEARKDNELIHRKNVSSNNVKITLAKNNSEIKPIGDITYSTIYLPADSYILCFSYDYDENLYREFKGSDSCLVINDPVEFAERIHHAFSIAKPDHIGVDARVTYSKHQSHLGPLFSKPQKYIFQREYRFAWIPNNPKQLLNPKHLIENDIDEIRKIIPHPVELILGSIKDISDIVERKKL
ncbi:MAG: hypothetical protein JRJ86_17150 [Deltaproteobacteria bacterium]|nr:hypothetical protein [Deltaproteobacteria bacterium]